MEWIMPVIESIYSQGYDNTKFEVVITDNGRDSKLPERLATVGYPNLRYKQTSDEGFLNLVSCLKEGKGLFCKMINHRSVLLPGSIAEMVSVVEKYMEEQPIIYFSDGVLSDKRIYIECPNIDSFVRHLSYYCSWSAGIGFWQKDIINIDTIILNKMFPNTSLLFEIRQDAEYVIWNEKYQNMGSDDGKGGYDLFHTFAVDLPDILSDLVRRRRISEQTFKLFKKELFGFLRNLYYCEVVMPTKHTFIIKDVYDNITVYYGRRAYYMMVFWSYLKAIRSRLKRRKR